jgi:hypothetical protein
MKALIIFFVAIALSGCASKSPKMKLEDIATNKVLERPEQMLNWLNNCKQNCSSPDNKIAGLLHEGYSELFAIAKSTPDYRQLTEEQRKSAAQAKIKVRQGFLEILKNKNSRDILIVAYKALAEKDSFYVINDSGFQAIMDDTIKRLKSDKNTQTTGWYLQSFNEKQTLSTLTALFECLKIDANDVLCREDYKHWSKVYERPWCDNSMLKKQVAVGKLVLKKISKKSSKKSTALSLPRSEIENVYLDNQQLDFDILGLTISSKKIKEMKTQFENFEGIDLSLVINGQNLPVGILRVTEPSRRIAIDFPRGKAAGEFFKKFCPQPKSNAIPKEIKL